MQRWHLTALLAGAAVIAVALAPRLTAHISAPDDVPPPPPPTPAVEPTPVVVNTSTPEPVPPVDSGHLVVRADLDREAVLSGVEADRFLTVTLNAPEDLGQAYRRSVDMAVVMDSSGSMSARGKIDYAKRAAKLLASSMEPGDVYSLVTFSDDAATIVPATPINDPQAIHAAIDGVLEGGGTNLYSGMERGSSEVQRMLHGENVGRVVILSDGNANVGVTDPDALARFAATLSAHGVSVSTIGLGLDYNEDLLARIADVGGGSYDFVDDPRELAVVFGDELRRSASLVARNVTVRIELPDGVQPLDLYGWDAERSGSTWTVNVGSVYAGESRKIVTRVRVGAADVGDLSVATVASDYHDVVDDAAGHVTAVATASVTQSPQIVEASVNRDASIEANRAYGNWFLDLSTRAYDDGDGERAQQLAAQGADVLQQAAIDFDEGTLADEAEDLVEVQSVFSARPAASPEGQYAIKASKEMYRGRAR